MLDQQQAEHTRTPAPTQARAEVRRPAAPLLYGLLLIACIALTDWQIDAELPLGFLYLLPMMMLGRVLKPWQSLVVAAICTILTELFDSYRWNLRTGLPRDALYFAAFFAVALVIHQVARNRMLMEAKLTEIEALSEARREAEHQLHVLIESSPAAIVTTDSGGKVLMANQTAHRMLAVEPPHGLLSKNIARYLPALSAVTHRADTRPLVRSVMQAHGVREDGDSFIAEILFSTYQTDAGLRMAAMFLDASEELRSREQSSLSQILASSRIAVSAVSHEIRNVCGAIRAVQQNLSRKHPLVGDKDLEALENLVLALIKIVSVELRPYEERSYPVDLVNILEDLRIVIAPSLSEELIECRWEIPAQLPRVWGDGGNLMQVLLNLTTNSIRILSERDAPRAIQIACEHGEQRVVVRVSDNGGGVAAPQDLFRPFQPGAQQTGLGVYLSRAFARSFGGELRYSPIPNGSCFMLELVPVDEEVS